MSDLKKLTKKIEEQILKAVNDYNIIDEGDKILVAVSGGKDSLTLLHFLKKLQNKIERKYDLFAVNVKTDSHCGESVREKALTDIFNSLEIDYRFVDIKILDENGETNCFWCSWNRRKVLFELAAELGCKKIALGHHQDDIIETLLMNMFYHSEISTMIPKLDMFKGEIAMIRPLCYVKEADLIDFSSLSNFSVQFYQCPFGIDSRRKKVKRLLAKVEEISPGIDIKSGLFDSMAKMK